MRGFLQLLAYGGAGVSVALLASLFGACGAGVASPGAAGTGAATSSGSRGAGGEHATAGSGGKGSGGKGSDGGVNGSGGMMGGSGGAGSSGGPGGTAAGPRGRGGGGGAGGAGGSGGGPTVDASACTHAGGPGQTCRSPCDCDVTLCPTYPMFDLADCVSWGSGLVCACTCIKGDDAACNSSCCAPVNGGAFWACAPSSSCP